MAVQRPAREAPGQHFLRSKQLAADLAAEARVGPGDVVVEIGGGTGVLTQALARTGAGVIVVERDQALAARLRVRFGHLAAVEIVRADAVEHKWPREPFIVGANLPFARSGAIRTGAFSPMPSQALDQFGWLFGRRFRCCRSSGLRPFSASLPRLARGSSTPSSGHASSRSPAGLALPDRGAGRAARLPRADAKRDLN